VHIIGIQHKQITPLIIILIAVNKMFAMPVQDINHFKTIMPVWPAFSGINFFDSQFKVPVGFRSIFHWANIPKKAVFLPNWKRIY
jgi:hypothetical protein